MSSNANLLDKLAAFIWRFMSLPSGADFIFPVWTLHTHIFDLFEFTPYLNVLSPEPVSGKTTVADILSCLCARATTPVSASVAALRRKVSADRPTLILDEWDTLDRNMRSACINFLNTGFRFDGTYRLVVNGQDAVFSTFSPKAIFGLAVTKLPEMTRSRCIQVVLQRAGPDQNLEKFRAPGRAEAITLREECEKWAQSFRALSVRAAPAMPEQLKGRQEDIAEPLLAVADACGGVWPEAVRKALVALMTEEPVRTPGNELLRAIKEFLKERRLSDGESFWSTDFCDWANKQEERPWCDRQLTPAKLADMLSGYGIRTRQILRGGKNKRGYDVTFFDDVFRSYLSHIRDKPL